MSTEPRNTDARSGTELTIIDALTAKQEGESSSWELEQPPIDCPRCGRELENGPYGTYVCWVCPERVAIRSENPGGRR